MIISLHKKQPGNMQNFVTFTGEILNGTFHFSCSVFDEDLSNKGSTYTLDSYIFWESCRQLLLQKTSPSMFELVLN